MSQDYIVPEGTRRERADKILAQAFPEHSRSALHRAFDSGLVSVGDKVLAKSGTVVAGDVIRFALPEVSVSELRPVDIPLDVIFEDKHLIAINKPAGMIVHPGAGTGEDTVVHAMLSHCEGELSGVGGVERPGIVHRIDKETTGLLLVAKSDAAHRGLSEQFAGRQLRKEYLALVSGVPQLLSGVIDRAISRHPVHRQRMTVGEGGKPARTDWERIEAFPPVVSLMRLRIHTGRTHQIRVHMKSIGHILLGDSAYGWREDLRLTSQPERVMLHAEHIEFLHPITGRAMDLRAPLPKDFEAILKSLRKPKK